MEKIKKKILVIDDSLAMQRLLSFVLEKEGYEVEIATNGAEGFEKAKTFKPDLIFTDLLMPFKDGYELCQDIRSTPEIKNTAIIVLTSKAETNNAQKALEIGANDYLIKPFDPPKVISRVREVIGAQNNHEDSNEL